ncbi:MAG: type I restriction enzyme HsdR N-terminal domain-containing protein [Bacteroidota bacterium]
MYLNFSKESLKIIENEKGKHIFDPSRNKYVKFTPEEFVRQSCIVHLNQVLKYPISRISTESSTKYNVLLKRTDLIIYDSNLKPLILIECKSFRTNLTNNTIDQVLRYNYIVKAKYICMTNGHQFICAITDETTGEISMIDDLPTFDIAN